jgi:methionyl-tRNA formyltransferase
MHVNILIAGQKYFGAEVFRALRTIPSITITAIAAPTGGEQIDRLTAQALLHGIPVIPSGTLKAETMPDDIDLIVAAHSHDFIGERTRLRSRFGGIGYHPSLLPLHRGRDAIRWAIRMRDRITGGTVYRLSNRLDGGHILAQQHVFIRPDDTANELWRRDLSPLGVRLLTHTVTAYAESGYQHGEPQDESLATWEPSINRPPLYRPDLTLLPPPNQHTNP